MGNISQTISNACGCSNGSADGGFEFSVLINLQYII